MNESEKSDISADATAHSANPHAAPAQSTGGSPTQQRQGSRRWWIKLFLQPALLVLGAALVFAGLGVAQRLGFIENGSAIDQNHASAHGSAARYICPMMCTPPQSKPGRCPVCAMELVPSTSGNTASDPLAIRIDPVARRIANIRTSEVTSMPMTRTIRAIGEISYDEGTLKTLSAYVDGRVDRLYADYTGVVVKKGDHLALVYSPKLYTGQVELLLARKARGDNRGSSLTRTSDIRHNLYDTTRQRLIELGMTDAQLGELEASGDANSRIYLCAPISGTVIEKAVTEGQYVKEGQAIYKLADLSTVWLMLELFPEDAALMRYGQQFEATVHSLPGRVFTGRVAFIDPNVDPKTRTVGVRVVVPNPDGLLRVGDYAKAQIGVALASIADPRAAIYDPELADKWISPRHPQIVEASAGKCPICGVDLVPAARFGFTAEASASGEALTVPRNAVLMAGESSVVYVETEPGRFEIRRVVLGPNCGDDIVILSGVTRGERVATQGNFLIDSQMQLAGNPSLIDPTKAVPRANDVIPAELIAILSQLSANDRALAETQRICPVTMMPLGSMGVPKKVDVDGKQVFICCDGCRQQLLKDPQAFLRKLAASAAPAKSRDNEPPNVPPIGDPRMIGPQSDLPPIETPRAIEEESTEADRQHATGQRTEAVR
jgi:Cu(I)/Ag(I) efflux system membrane fusion protein